jgi:hypothetical protein
MTFRYQNKTYKHLSELSGLPKDETPVWNCKKPDAMPVTKHTTSRQDKMNGTEAEALILLKERYPLARIFFHAIKLQVGESRCDYTPDFLVSPVAFSLPRPIVVEVKGQHRFRTQGRNKYQAARLLYPCFDFLWMEKMKDGTWRYET